MLWKLIMLPSKHDTSTQCWSNIGPTSTTVAQHWTNIVLMYRVYCDTYQWNWRCSPLSFSTHRSRSVHPPLHNLWGQNGPLYTNSGWNVYPENTEIGAKWGITIINENRHRVVCGFNPYSAGIDFRRQNLPSVDAGFWRLKSIPAL